MAKFIAQIVIAGTQIVARAFARAVKEEIQASQEAARRLGNTKSRAERIANTQLGLSVEEAKQILDVKNLNKEEVCERYEFLFKNNEKEKGGSFYLQSKVVRAKERLDHELLNAEKQEKPGDGSKT